jgi:hypothetical protein
MRTIRGKGIEVASAMTPIGLSLAVPSSFDSMARHRSFWANFARHFAPVVVLTTKCAGVRPLSMPHCNSERRSMTRGGGAANRDLMGIPLHSVLPLHVLYTTFSPTRFSSTSRNNSRPLTRRLVRTVSPPSWCATKRYL